jgi:hypothetical protein
VEAVVRRTLAQLDVDAVADPLTELSKLAGQVVSWKDALAEQVNALTQLRYEASGAGTEQLRAEVALWERVLDRYAAVLGMIVKLGLDERMVVIQQTQADVVIRAVDGRSPRPGSPHRQSVRRPGQPRPASYGASSERAGPGVRARCGGAGRPRVAAEVQAAVAVLADEVEHSSLCLSCHLDADMVIAVEVLSGRFDVTLVNIAEAVVELAEVLVPSTRRPCERWKVA